eukprot:2815219-Amphidinium_carterae.1
MGWLSTKRALLWAKLSKQSLWSGLCCFARWYSSGEQHRSASVPIGGNTTTEQFVAKLLAAEGESSRAQFWQKAHEHTLLDQPLQKTKKHEVDKVLCFPEFLSYVACNGFLVSFILDFFMCFFGSLVIVVCESDSDSASASAEIHGGMQ